MFRSIPSSTVLGVLPYTKNSYMSHNSYVFIYLLILLFGDLQSYPGLVSCVYPLNIRCFTNLLRYTAIVDLADIHKIDVFAHIKTRMSPNTTSAQLFEAIPHLH